MANESAEKLELIKQKQEEIDRLRKEISELKKPSSIKSLLKNEKVYEWNSDTHELILSKNFCFENMWKCIKELSIELFKPKYRPHRLYSRVKVKDLTHKEVRIAAEFSDEIIDIWNKYMLKIYGDKVYGDKEVQ